MHPTLDLVNDSARSCPTSPQSANDASKSRSISAKHPLLLHSAAEFLHQLPLGDYLRMRRLVKRPAVQIDLAIKQLTAPHCDPVL